MSVPANPGKSSWQHTRPNLKVILYGVLIVIQAVAAALAAAKSHQGTSPTLALILLALVVTITAGIREMVKEVTGPDYRMSKEVSKAHHLLEFISERFPALMTSLSGAVTAKTIKDQTDNISALQNAVLTETSQLVPKEKLRVAIFRSDGTNFRASPYFPGWDKKPTCPGKGVPGMIRAVFEEDDEGQVFRVYSEDIEQEDVVQTRAFKFSETCQSLVAVPIRSSNGLTGFLHVECDKKKILDQRAADVIVALGQLISIAFTLEQRNQQDAEHPEQAAGGSNAH